MGTTREERNCAGLVIVLSTNRKCRESMISKFRWEPPFAPDVAVLICCSNCVVVRAYALIIWSAPRGLHSVSYDRKMILVDDDCIDKIREPMY